MGYLDNSSITVDAILTKRGRELLARNDGSFRITQFALGDDEIDYTLFNENHPNGSQFSGEAIENMPLIEAIPDESNIMRHKLVTLPKGTSVIPVVSVGNLDVNGITVNNAESFTIEPNTINFQAGNTTFGYTAILSDSSVAQIVGTGGVAGQTVPRFVGDSSAAKSVTVSGTSFTITG